MLKPSSNYKMSAQTKRSLTLGTYRNDEDRNAWKRAMIQAELAAAMQPKREKNRRDNSAE